MIDQLWRSSLLPGSRDHRFLQKLLHPETQTNNKPVQAFKVAMWYPRCVFFVQKQEDGASFAN